MAGEGKERLAKWCCGCGQCALATSDANTIINTNTDSNTDLKTD